VLSGNRSLQSRSGGATLSSPQPRSPLYQRQLRLRSLVSVKTNQDEPLKSAAFTALIVSTMIFANFPLAREEDKGEHWQNVPEEVFILSELCEMRFQCSPLSSSLARGKFAKIILLTMSAVNAADFSGSS
jgi:hypothetical protein